MFALFIIGCIFAYVFVGGVSCARIQVTGKAKCPYAPRGACDAECNHAILAGFSVLFWPLLAPFLIGMAIGRGEHISKAEKRREEEIAEAKHQTELARIAMEEDAHLTHQLAAIERRKK